MNAQIKTSYAGIFFNVPEAEYHTKKLGEFSNSAAKQMLRSPAHYKAYIEAKEDSTATPAQTFGKAFHCALFEPERFKETYVVVPDDAPRKPSITQINAKNPSADTVIAVNWWGNFASEGKLILSGEDMERIEAMMLSVQSHPWASKLVKGVETEVTLYWIDEATGLECKARADAFKDLGAKRYVVDAKSCLDASPAAFAKAVHSYGYHIQHAHYCKGFAAVGKPLANYLILAIESEAPYVCQVYCIDAEAEARGYELIDRAAQRTRECLDSGKWPGYSEDITTLSLPAWSLKD